MKILFFMFLCGNLGLLIENYFTGIKSLFGKKWTADTQTSLWMFFVWAFGVLPFKIIDDNIVVFNNVYFNSILLALIFYMPLFYGIEAISGLISLKIFKRVLWDYGLSKYTPLGLINLKYSPFWLFLSLFIHPIILYFGRFIDFIQMKII